MHIPRFHFLSVALVAAAGSSAAQELRVFPFPTTMPPIVHWDATSNLGPMGAFNQSYALGGDLVVEFDQSPASGIARVTDGRLIVPNGVVAVILAGHMGTVAFFDLELGASTPDFTLVPGAPGAQFATTLDLVVKSGSVRVEPPFGPAFLVVFADTPLASIPITGSFPSIGPAQGMRIDPFDFDMPFSATGWNGAFTHHVPATQLVSGCPPPSPYCASDPSTPGGGTQLAVVGSTSVLADDFTLAISSAPASTFGVFFHGARRGDLLSGFGRVCVGGPLERLGVVPTDANGATSLRVVLAQHQTGPLALVPGAHAHFQFYHRIVTPSGGGWNYSNAIAVTFCP